ncbi:hypothetical protein HaLaN_10843, partial [Haematococcus lacustris]
MSAPLCRTHCPLMTTASQASGGCPSRPTLEPWAWRLMWRTP